MLMNETAHRNAATFSVVTIRAKTLTHHQKSLTRAAVGASSAISESSSIPHGRRPGIRSSPQRVVTRHGVSVDEAREIGRILFGTWRRFCSVVQRDEGASSRARSSSLRSERHHPVIRVA